MLDRLAAVPGVTAAAAMRSLPVVDGEPQRQFAHRGRPATPTGDAPWAVEAAVFGDYATRDRRAAARGTHVAAGRPRLVMGGGAGEP